MRYVFITVLLIVAALSLQWSLFTVDPTEFVYVTQFGRHVGTLDGSRDSEAGLHGRWPWPIQSLQRLDRRVQYFDLLPVELVTHDPKGKTIDKMLTVDAYVCWRIAPKDNDADAVDRFIRSLGTLEYAQSVLGKRINSQVGAAIGQMGMDDFISTVTMPEAGGKPRVEVKLEGLRQNLLKVLQDPLSRDYGIELIDIRLRRFNYPAGEPRRAIFDSIISERNKKAEKYRSEGKKAAEDIRSENAKKIKNLEAKAEADAKILKGQADTESDRIRNEAQSKDPEFYVFLRRLELYQSLLGDKTVLLLSTHRPLFDQLFAPPPLEINPKSENRNPKQIQKSKQE